VIRRMRFSGNLTLDDDSLALGDSFAPGDTSVLNASG